LSRTKTRARRRRARSEAEHERKATEIKDCLVRKALARTAEEEIAANSALVKLLKGIADSDHLRLWSFVDALVGPDDPGPSLGSSMSHHPAPGAPSAGAKVAREEADATKALIAQLVAPHLAGRPPRWVQSPDRAPCSGERDYEPPDNG
jgi:hypothetical protein